MTIVFAETGAEPIADSLLSAQFGRSLDAVDVRQLLLEGIELGYRRGREVEKARTCLCPEWLPREESGHVYESCPFYCDRCSYDTHDCRGCGDNLTHDSEKGHICE